MLFRKSKCSNAYFNYTEYSHTESTLSVLSYTLLLHHGNVHVLHFPFCSFQQRDHFLARLRIHLPIIRDSVWHCRTTFSGSHFPWVQTVTYCSAPFLFFRTIRYHLCLKKLSGTVHNPPGSLQPATQHNPELFPVNISLPAFSWHSPFSELYKLFFGL